MTSENPTYKPIILPSGRWVIEVTDPDGTTHIMTCGRQPTLEQVWKRILWLRMDDDNIDTMNGKSRVFQG